jgi:hypothetical protein
MGTLKVTMAIHELNRLLHEVPMTPRLSIAVSELFFAAILLVCCKLTKQQYISLVPTKTFQDSYQAQHVFVIKRVASFFFQIHFVHTIPPPSRQTLLGLGRRTGHPNT